MRIERIELIGFKSFADRTTFHFHPGITCIVGPNGCGKSNIVDAFRWVLGEQSAKSLRGEKMEEVIFNGSVSKKPKGMADVTMVLSGLHGTTQTPGTEDGEAGTESAQVTRRLYRSGDSEYLLNRNQSRLKDVKDLFLDTGLEVKSYSILEQDRIAEILNAKPQDRRILIEEVAGVMKYNVRKKEALSKLESSRSNLQRVNDIIIEVKKQINLLDRLAKKAERYKKLSAEMHSIELKIFKRDYGALSQSFENILSEFQELKENEASLRSEYSTIESASEKARLELLEKEKDLEKINNEFQRLEREIAENEKHSAIAKTEIHNNREYLEKLYQQENEFVRKEEETFLKQQERSKTEAEITLEINRHAELVQDKIDYVRTLDEELADKEFLLEENRKDIFKVSEELSQVRNEQGKLQSILDNLAHREASTLQDAEDLKKALSAIDDSLKNLESALLEMNNEMMLHNEKRTFLTNEISTHKEKVEHLREELSKKREELASHTSRISSLKEIVSDGTLKELLAEQSDFTLLATLSDIVDIDDTCEKAIESALAEKVNTLIVPSIENIESVLLSVKEKEIERVAFIPLHPSGHDGSQGLPEGVLGRATGFVRTKEEFAQVIKSLFDHIVIVQDLKTALELYAVGHREYYATLDGEVLEPSGTIIAGNVKGIFRRKREIRELETVIDHAKDIIARRQADLNTIQQTIEEKEAELKSIEAAIVEKEKEVSLQKLTAGNTRDERERKSRKLAYISLESEQIAKEKISIKQTLHEKETEYQAMIGKKEHLDRKSESLHEEITQRKKTIEERRSEITDLKLTMTTLRERVEAVHRDKENMIRELKEIAEKKEFLSAEIASIQSRIAQRASEMQEHEIKIKSLVTDADRLKDTISEKREILATENQALMAAEGRLKHLRDKIDAISQKTAELEIQKTEHRMKIESISDNVKQNYGHDIAVIEVDQLTDEDVTRLDDLRSKVKALGPVNLGTLEEYEELRSRYEFLKGQQEDLNKSIAELEEAIAKINTTTRRKLREAFDLLKAKFAEVFSKLFGGGRAELIMTDEHNILETGIDIVAQPPGKRLQNINLLSGGEKALTALSVLFASFLLKPTPLCILDEADSALDEANTEKFARTIQELSKDTQFIVVTHNRHTMSIADYIYGITMEEAGISKVISMQLVEAGSS